jgi:hypothetical protein
VSNAVVVPVADQDFVGGAAVAEHDVGDTGGDAVADVKDVAAAHGEGVLAVAVPVADPVEGVGGGAVADGADRVAPFVDLDDGSAVAT